MPTKSQLGQARRNMRSRNIKTRRRALALIKAANRSVKHV